MKAPYLLAICQVLPEDGRSVPPYIPNPESLAGFVPQAAKMGLMINETRVLRWDTGVGQASGIALLRFKVAKTRLIKRLAERISRAAELGCNLTARMG